MDSNTLEEFWREGGASLPEIKLPRLRLQVYLLLVDSVEGKRSQVQVQEYLGMPRSTVSYHVQKLLAEGYIKPVKDACNPQKYCKGPKSNVLDKYILDIGLQLSGATASPSPNPNIPLQPDSSFIPEVRVHANGRVLFKVEKLGDLREIKMHENGTASHIIPLFPKEPYLSPDKARGISAWKCKLPYNGEYVSIEYREGKGGAYLYVWPSQVMMTPDQLEDREIERVMFSQAQDVANFLSKHGGWRFSLPEFAGTIEKASDDPALLSQIRDDIHSVPGSDLWVDESPGKGHRELETNDTSTAKLVFGFRDVVKELRDGQKILVDQMYTLNLTVAQALELIQKITQMEVQLATAQAVRTTKDVLEKVRVPSDSSTESKSSIIEHDKGGVDYIG